MDVRALDPAFALNDRVLPPRAPSDRQLCRSAQAGVVVSAKRKPNPAISDNFDSPQGAQTSEATKDTAARGPALRAEILIPKDSPIRQVEIEVFAALLDDWDSLLADHGEGTKQ